MKRMCWEGGAWKLPKDWQALETTGARERAQIRVHLSLELSLHPRWLLYAEEDYGVTYAADEIKDHLTDFLKPTTDLPVKASIFWVYTQSCLPKCGSNQVTVRLQFRCETQ